MIENGIYAAELLKLHHVSDEIVLDAESVAALKKFREKIVGDDTDNVSDVIWANTVPLQDVELKGHSGMTVRVCIFSEALEALDEIPEGETGMVGAIQTGQGTFKLIGVVKGENRTDISFEDFDRNGRLIARSTYQDNEFELMRIWHGIQIALLNPQIQNVIQSSETVKRYTREDTEKRKRQRVVRYVKRHVINGNTLNRALTEYHRHCLAWYVIGHWRHYKNGHVVFIKPYWKGELRALKRNFDERQREVVV